MEETRSFRLVDTMNTVKITLNHVEGQDVVCWEDIEQIFPGVKRARNGNSVISFIRRSDSQSPSSVLEVVLTTTTKPAHYLRSDPTDGEKKFRTEAATDVPADDRVLDALEGAQPTEARLFHHIATQVSSKALESEVEERFISLLPPKNQETVRTSPDIYQAFGKVISHVHCENSREQLSAERNGPLLQNMEALMEAKIADLYDAMNAKHEKLQTTIAYNDAVIIAKQDEIKQIDQQVLEELQTTIAYNDAVIIAKQDDIKQLQQQVLDNQARLEQLQQKALKQLSVLQSRVQAVLTQTYELHEYPIPRLFVVLPQDLFGWDAMNPFANKFRLYFLCECGEHTEPINSKTGIPHDIHLAQHEGYEITQPSEFFQQYGSYVLTILKMIKYKIMVAGMRMPEFPQLIHLDVLGQSVGGLKLLQDTIVCGANQVIGMIENITVNDTEDVKGITGQVENKGALDGVNLRKMENFLKNKDGNKALGNLYKTVTDDGHVKWVCMDHYREKYNKSTVEAFRRTVDSLEGSFDENNSLVRVKLGSTASAKQFYLALGNSRFVHELDIILSWDCTGTDLQAMEDALRTSAVAVLHLDVQQFQPSLSSILFTLPVRYEALYRIMNPLNIKSAHIVLPRGLVKVSNFTPKKPPHLRMLSFEMRVGPARIHATMLDTGSTVTTLYLPLLSPDRAQALSSALETSSTLTILDLDNIAIGESGAQALSEALKTNSALTSLHLNNSAIGESGAQALSEALKTNSTLTTLHLNNNAIGGWGAYALSKALKANLTMTTLSLGGNSIGHEVPFPSSDAFSANTNMTTLELTGHLLSYTHSYNKALIALDESFQCRGAQELFKALKTNQTLTTLNLSQNFFRFDEANALSEALITNSTLTTLYLHFNEIGDSGAQALSEALKINSTLTTLNLESNSIGDSGAPSSTIAVLYKWCKSSGETGAQALSEALKINSTLITLHMGCNSIGEGGAQALSEALKTNSTLTTLTLGGNSIGDSGAQALSEALKTNSTLTTLNLRSNSFGDSGAQALSEALETNSTVTTLDLESNSIIDSTAQAISDALKYNSTQKIRI